MKPAAPAREAMWQGLMAAGFGMLGLSPAAFWAMTPREFEAALSVFAPAAVAPPGRDALAAMMRRFPDIRPKEE